MGGAENISDVVISDNESWTPEDPFVGFIHKLLLYIIYLIGFVANSFVCYTIARKKHMRTSLNLFLLSLAVADILLIITETFALLAFNDKDGFHRIIFSCSQLLFLFTFCDFNSAVQVAIPLVINAFCPRIRKLHSAIIITVVWLIAAARSVPNMLASELFTVVQPPRGQVTYCIRHSDSQIVKVFEQIESLLTLLPLTVLLIIVIVQKLILKRPLNRMLVLLVLIFVGSSIFLSTLKFMSSIDPKFKYNDILFRVFHLLSMIILVYKPFLYVTHDDEFKYEFQQLLKFLKGNSEVSYEPTE